MADELFLPPNPPKPFIGRESELEWLQSQISNREGGFGRPIVITGPPGIGKTALAARYINGPERVKIAVYGETKVGKTALIAAQMGMEKAPYSSAGPGEAGRGAVWVAARTFSNDGRNFEEFMRSRVDSRSDRELVVLDGVDEISEENHRRAISRILNFKRVRTLIVTSRKDLGLRGERTLHLDSLPTDDAQRLITGLSQLEPELIARILGLAGGHPLMLNMMATLAQSLSSEDLRKVLSGEAYRLQDDSAHSKLVATAKPLIISANEAIIRNLKKNPKDIFSTSIPATHSEAMQSELFRQLNLVDVPSATSVHGSSDSRVRPYTISALMFPRVKFERGQIRFQAGEPCWFRVTGLQTEASQLLLAMSERVRSWQLRSASFNVEFTVRRWCVGASEHPWAGLISVEDLGESAWKAAEREPDRMSFRFQSPTAFTVESESDWGNWLHLPLPNLVFASIRKRVATFCPELGKAPPRESLIEGRVALGKFKIESHILFFQRRNARRAGFVGDCEFMLDPTLTVPERLWLHLLAGFAFYSGVGASTSWGMGQARREPADQFCYRGR